MKVREVRKRASDGGASVFLGSVSPISTVLLQWGGTRSDIDVLHITFPKFHMLLVTCVAAQQKQHDSPASGIELNTFDKTLRQT